MFEYAVHFGFKASNNEAEYEAALAGINMRIAAGAKKIIMQKDSHLVSSQIEGTYEARVSIMQKYLSMVKHITTGI